jgi:DNA-binding response OmpR family regulator
MPKVWLATRDPVVEALFEEIPESCGMQIWGSSMGQESLSGIFRKNIRLVVIDDDLEDISGEELLNGIRDQDALLPVIFLTSEHTEEKERRIRGRGVLFYTAKPFSRELLSKLVCSAVDHETTKLVRSKANYR